MLRSSFLSLLICCCRCCCCCSYCRCFCCSYFGCSLMRFLCRISVLAFSWGSSDVWRHLGLVSYLIFTLRTAHQLFMSFLLLLFQGNGAEKVQLAIDSGQQLKQFAILVFSICKQRCHLSNFDVDAGKATTKKENRKQKPKIENQNKIN